MTLSFGSDTVIVHTYRDTRHVAIENYEIAKLTKFTLIDERKLCVI